MPIDLTDTPDAPLCDSCGEAYAPARAALGYALCLRCGDKAAHTQRQSWTVAPLHKSNYQLITDRSLLVGVNVKGGNVK